MIALIGTALSILAPLFKWGIQALLKSKKISDDDKLWLIDADKILSQRNFNDIKRAKDLETRLPEMDQEMDDIEAGLKPNPWEIPDEQ